MEALSSGLPVVCSELTQVRSAFGDSAAYVSEENAFGKQLLDVLGGDGDLNRVDEQFSWEKTVKKTMSMVKGIVDKK